MQILVKAVLKLESLQDGVSQYFIAFRDGRSGPFRSLYTMYGYMSLYNTSSLSLHFWIQN